MSVYGHRRGRPSHPDGAPACGPSLAVQPGHRPMLATDGGWLAR